MVKLNFQQPLLQSSESHDLAKIIQNFFFLSLNLKLMCDVCCDVFMSSDDMKYSEWVIKITFLISYCAFMVLLLCLFWSLKAPDNFILKENVYDV